MSEYFGLGSPRRELNNALAEIERLTMSELPASRKLLNITKAALDHAEAECERLRSIAFGAEEHAQTVRKATIEECARVAERYWIEVEQGERPADGVADAIRALKDKP